jgi:cytochrome oxidase assembly protein ShyY1
VYRFLLTWRWLGGAALAVAAAVVMVMLGNWQLHRYEERSAINARIDAADSTRAVAMTSVVAAPTGAGTAGASPGNGVAWTKVTVSGRYDPAHEIQARGRTVNGDVGFEIVTPLLLDDGTAVLVDRGWVPAPDAGATAAPVVPPAPAGPVTVVGQIHLSESRPAPIEHRDGRLDTRRIAVPRLAHEMPYPVYGAYVLLTEQTPAEDKTFTRIPIDHEDSWQNAGYTVQWWLFAGMALFAYGWQARKEALGETPPPRKAAPELVPAGARSPADVESRAGAGASAGDLTAGGDRVEEADRRAAARRAPIDRVEEADRKKAAAEAAAKSPGQSGPA